MGKSALAVCAGHLVSVGFPDGQIFVDLRGLGPGEPADVSAVMRQILRAIGLPADELPSPTQETVSWYRSSLAGRRLLLVLDNAHGAEQVIPSLPGAAGCAVIITSRRPIGALAEAHQIRLDVLAESEAVHLLSEAIGTQRVSVDHASATELVRLCGRLPLALHLAAARLAARPDWPLSYVVQRLKAGGRSLDELESTEDGGLRDSFAATLSQLESSARWAERQAAHAFALFGAVDCPHLSTDVAGRLLNLPEPETDRVLQRMADFHLLQAQAPDLYRMHDLLRVYAGELADALPASETAGAITRVLELFAAVAWRGLGLLWTTGSRATWAQEAWLAPAPPFSEPTAAFAWLDAHQPQLLTLAAKASKTPGVPGDLLIRLALGLMPYFSTRGHSADWIAMCELVLGVAKDELTEAMVRMALGLAYGSAAVANGASATTGLQELEHALKLFERVGSAAHVATCVINLAHACTCAGLVADGIAYGERALALSQDNDDTIGTAIALLNLGYLYGAAGDRLRETAAYRKCLPLLQKLGDSHRAAIWNV